MEFAVSYPQRKTSGPDGKGLRPEDLEQIRLACLQMIRRRALIAAAASFVPIPGAGLITDTAVLVSLIDDINEKFALDKQTIGQLAPARKALAYQLMTRAGGMLAARLSTSRLLGLILQRAGLRLGLVEATRYAPLVGQAISAAIAYFILTGITRRHVDECAQLAQAFRQELHTPV
jgi:uncharacterized protein (DUF697 family)